MLLQCLANCPTTQKSTIEIFANNLYIFLPESLRLPPDDARGGGGLEMAFMMRNNMMNGNLATSSRLSARSGANADQDGRKSMTRVSVK